MELFLPGVIVLLLAAFFIFLIIPRFGSTILVGASVVALCVAFYNHVNLFGSEYRLSTWQMGLAASAPWFVLFLSFLFVIGAIRNIFSGSSNSPSIADQISNSVSSSVSNMPSAKSATNPLTSLVNTAIENTKSLLNNSKNKSPIIPGLGYKSSNV
jgi:hypothetical protein